MLGADRGDRADWWRDISAVVLLLVSLVLPWDAGGVWNAETRTRPLIAVLIVTLLALLGAVYSVMGRFGHRHGDSSSNRLVVWRARIRVTAALPLAALIALFVLRGLWSVAQGGTLTVGSAMALSLAGVVLLAQRRDAELVSESAQDRARRNWAGIAVVFVYVVVVACLLSVVFSLSDFLGTIDVGASAGGIVHLPRILTLTAVVGTVSVSLLVLVPAMSAVTPLRGRNSPCYHSSPRIVVARRILVVLGLGVVFACVIGIFASWGLPQVEYLRLPLQATWQALTATGSDAKAPANFAAMVFGDGGQPTLLAAFGGVVPLSGWLGMGLLALPVLAAIMMAPGLIPRGSTRSRRRFARPTSVALLWWQAGVSMSVMIAAVLRIATAVSVQRIDGFWMVDRLVHYVDGGGALSRLGLSAGPMIVTMVITGASALTSAYAASSLRRSVPRARAIALIASGISVLVGVASALLAPKVDGAVMASVLDDRVIAGALSTLPTLTAVTYANVLLAVVLPVATAVVLRNLCESRWAKTPSRWQSRTH